MEMYRGMDPPADLPRVGSIQAVLDRIGRGRERQDVARFDQAAIA